MQILRKKINPYIVYAAAFFLLAGFFAVIHEVAQQGATAAAKKDEDVRLLNSEADYNVRDNYKAQSDKLPAFDFPALNVVPGKIPKGWQIAVKGARVIDQKATPDGTKSVCIVQRTESADGKEWTELDSLVADPHTQSFSHEALALVYGPWRQAAADATKIAGFLSSDDFVFTSVRNDGEDLTYFIGIYQMQNNMVKPLLKFGQLKTNDAGKPAIQSAWLSPDKNKVYIRDGQNAVFFYDLKAGGNPQTLAAAGGANGAFWVSDQAGIAYASSRPYAADGVLIQLNSGETKKPFAAEPGWIEPGLAAKGKMVYYNFTNDRSPAHLVQGDKRTMLLPQGVQLTDTGGAPLKRFILGTGSKEYLEYGGYAEEKNAVILHKYTVSESSGGRLYKKTTGWLLGDMNTGKMTELIKNDVPDGWDRKDIAFAQTTVDAYADSGKVQAFINMPDGTYYMTRWNTQEVNLMPEEDTVIYEDEPSKRVFISSFTRPDLVVSALSYKKYNWDNRKFAWLSGRWLTRYQSLPDGDKIYFFQIM
ncbi:hypothetical protein [Paenibacillus hamazuiensis]|uniref:hypothetical protein n=1 Tax=Paenibacillus hamazuiensis TaxID=2936508 RepID=UPI00200DCF32|nr:hypothetical protein [Paenibacillus hamazuiensis]